MIVTKKTIDKLGSRMNDAAGSKPSAFAMKQMEKMGWTEGKGLGKTESGISKHLSIQKRDDNAGIGADKVEENGLAESWWHDSFSSNLKSFKSKFDSDGAKKDKKDKKSKKSDGKKSSRKEKEFNPDKAPSFAELFEATGGARLGMRARADQPGKLKRTEDSDSVFAAAVAAADKKKKKKDVGGEVEVKENDKKEEVEETSKKAKKDSKDDKEKKKDKKEKRSSSDVAEAKEEEPRPSKKRKM